MFGCREYQLYNFKEINDSVLSGDLVVQIIPSRALDEKDGKKIAIEANPYSLRIKFFSLEPFFKIKVSDLKLVGKKSGVEIILSESSSLDAVKFPDSDKYYAIVSFSDQLINTKLNYESYSLSGVISVENATGEIEYADISYLIETDYKTDNRSDIIDGMMGI